MRLASLILSVVLHTALFLAIIFWPTKPLLKLDAAPVLISLVDGAPGGNRAPSPILGPQGQRNDSGKIAPSMPAPQKAEAAPAVPDTAAPVVQPKEEPKKPEPKPAPKPKEPEPQATPIAEKKEAKKEPPKEEPKPEPPKPEPKKEEKKPEPPKPEPKKEEPKPAAKPAPKADPVKDALNKAKAASSRENSPNKGSAVERALAEAKRNAGGFGGGGGGEGDGEGGGGLGDVYIGQVMLAVRPNWQMASARRDNLVCAVRVRLDAQGTVLDARLEHSSGNAQFDGSAVNAVVRTGASRQFPAPPSPEYHDLILTFNLNEMLGR